MPDESSPTYALIRTVLQGSQLSVLLAILVGIVKLIWMASAFYTGQTAALDAERAARLATEATMKMEYTGIARAIGGKIDNNTQMTTQQLTTLNDKVTDLKNTMTEIVRASTPDRHR